jgi:hypothetical protein
MQFFSIWFPHKRSSLKHLGLNDLLPFVVYLLLFPRYECQKWLIVSIISHFYLKFDINGSKINKESPCVKMKEVMLIKT